jgi:hypothetical protein
MSKVTLNREQIGKLTEIVDHFHGINHFTIEADTGSGIGVGVTITFDLFEKNDTKVNITAHEEW